MYDVEFISGCIVASNFLGFEELGMPLKYSDIEKMYSKHNIEFRRSLNIIENVEDYYKVDVGPMFDANLAALANHRNEFNFRLFYKEIDYGYVHREDFKKVLKIIKHFKNNRVINEFNYLKNESPISFRKLLQSGVDRHLYENKNGIFGTYQKKTNLCNIIINDLSSALSCLPMEDLQILKDFSDENPQLFAAMLQPCMLYVLGNAVYVKSVYPLYNRFYGEWGNVCYDTFHKIYSKIYIQKLTYIAFPTFFFRCRTFFE